MEHINKIIHGNCLEKLKELPENSVDSIVTDPPYELGFMGKSWDNTGIANNPLMWAECLRVLKPGGHMLAFSGTRTYHRMASAIEDAGFEVRDMIEWVYGSGFPKSHNIGKAVDKLQGNEREVTGKQVRSEGRAFAEGQSGFAKGEITLTKGTSQWEGWGTALKPAHEPICMARKPLEEKTVAENVLKYGTGGINIDESRVEAQGEVMSRPFNDINENGIWNSDNSGYKKRGNPNCVSDQLGRFPANLIHDNSEEVRECFPESTSGARKAGFTNKETGYEASSYEMRVQWDKDVPAESGNASRFFKSIIYQAKASKSERNKGCEELEEKESGMPLMIQREWEQGERDRITDILSKYIVDTDSDCAEKFGVSSALVRFWKRGERTPTQENLRLLKKVYNFGDSVDDLLNINLIVKTNRETILDKSYRPLAKNNHPTVKPIALMEYLIKMVTPKGGIVLDPFAGSGSTLVAAKQNGFNYVGIEMTEEYLPIINARLGL